MAPFPPVALQAIDDASVCCALYGCNSAALVTPWDRETENAPPLALPSSHAAKTEGFFRFS